MPHTVETTGAEYVPDPANPTFFDLQKHLPPKTDPHYETHRNFIVHILSNDGAVFPDFACVMGRSLHLIDIRQERDLRAGFIPGANWFPCTTPDISGDEELISRIQAQFPARTMMSIVCKNGVQSRRITNKLRQAGHAFVSVYAGGIRLYKYFGFSLSHHLADFINGINQPRSIMKFHDLVTDDLALTRAAKLVYHQHQQNTQRELSDSTTVTTADVATDVCDVDTANFDFAVNQSIIAEQVARHVSSDIQWCKMAALSLQLRLSCIDGRGDGGIIGTPGGDFGVLVLIVSTYEFLTHSLLSFNQLKTLFSKRLDTFGRFYLHTDDHNAHHAIERIKQELPDDLIAQIEQELNDDSTLPSHWFKHFVSKIPEEYHSIVLDILINPDYIGCGHIKLMMLHPAQYGVRRQLIEDVFRIFFESIFWGPDSENTECDYVVLSGSHRECGILSVELTNTIRPYTKIPLISPSITVANGSKQMFVNHPTIIEYLRQQQCHWLIETVESMNADCTRQSLPPMFKSLTPTALHAYNPLVQLNAEKHATLTTGYLAQGLPVYTLQFDVEHSNCKVSLTGFIEREQDPNTPELLSPTEEPSNTTITQPTSCCPSTPVARTSVFPRMSRVASSTIASGEDPIVSNPYQEDQEPLDLNTSIVQEIPDLTAPHALSELRLTFLEVHNTLEALQSTIEHELDEEPQAADVDDLMEMVTKKTLTQMPMSPDGNPEFLSFEINHVVCPTFHDEE